MVADDTVTELRIAGTVDDSIVDGPGIRFTIFTQGCSHRCKGCHNPQTHDPMQGTAVTVDELWRKIKQNRLLSGVTFSGGEPFDQPRPLVELALLCREDGLNIWAYSGYSYEDLLNDTSLVGAADLLRLCDVLVDGLYMEALGSFELKWRGSSNQRIIDVPASLDAGSVVELEF